MTLATMTGVMGRTKDPADLARKLRQRKAAPSRRTQALENILAGRKLAAMYGWQKRKVTH